jgi:hypothetical protein
MSGDRSFTSLGARVGELEAAWRDRLLDAEHLVQAGRHSMAIAMGLYALEILLKVRICRKLDLKSLPRPFEIHDLAGLLILSGLSRAMTSKNARLVKANWDKIKTTAKDLNELRYKPGAMKSQEQSEQFFAQLKDPTGGVLSWIANQP